jgi:hypothetical protein
MLWCCLAALPLIGCAGGPTAVSQQQMPPSAVTAYPAPPHLYRTEPAAPAAILVVLPGTGALGSDPALWANAGFDIVTPPPAAGYRLAAEQEAAFAQMMATAQRLVDAPIWLLGPNQAIEAALRAPQAAGEQISGVVETSSGARAGTCSESFSYFDPGTGAKPQVRVSKSGNCPPGSGFAIGGPTVEPPTFAPTAPSLQPRAPRVIEASATPAMAAPAAVERLAELIKDGPAN